MSSVVMNPKWSRCSPKRQRQAPRFCAAIFSGILWMWSQRQFYGVGSAIWVGALFNVSYGGSELLPLHHRGAAVLWLAPVYIRNAQVEACFGSLRSRNTDSFFFFPVRLIHLIFGMGPKQINNATCLQGQTVRSVLTPSGPLPSVLSSFSDLTSVELGEKQCCCISSHVCVNMWRSSSGIPWNSGGRKVSFVT